jgi:pyruvate/2-oxoglutarate dehydrogenase complex dihydrolipoamide acyltransferase (E2) component
MNAVTNTSSHAVASLQTLKQGLANVKTSLPETTGEPFLRLDGVWLYGPENIEVEPGSQWAINPLSFKHGFCSWTRHPAESKKKNELVGEVMVAMTAPKPAQVELRDTGWDWNDQVSFQLKCLTGEDVGEQVLYKNSSKGGINATGELIGAIMAQLDKDPSRPVPVVTLDKDFYNHKTYGRTDIPVFKIERWVELSDELPADAPAAQSEPAKEPAAAAAATPARRRGGASVPETGQAAQQQAEEPATQTVSKAEQLRAELARIEAEEAAAAGAKAPAQAEAQPSGDAPRRRRRG